MDGLDARTRLLVVEHDFAKDGGAVGDITMRGGGLPKGAVIIGTTIRIITTYLSGGAATVALKCEGAADLLAATAKASLVAGIMTGKQDRNSASTNVLTTSTQNIVATVAVAALTAGNMRVALEYVILDA